MRDSLIVVEAWRNAIHPGRVNERFHRIETTSGWIRPVRRRATRYLRRGRPASTRADCEAQDTSQLLHSQIPPAKCPAGSAEIENLPQRNDGLSRVRQQNTVPAAHFAKHSSH